MSRRALVTGGAGFIGSHLVARLLREGFEVRVLDNLATGNRGNVPDSAEVEWFEEDVRNAELVSRAATGVDCIWHQAALASVPRSIEDPILTHEVNVNGTLNVLAAARDRGVPRVVLASSSSVYGETPTLPKREDMPPAPVSPYAAQKLVNELYARQFTLHYGIKVVCLRYFNIFGPRQEPNSAYAAVLPCFVKRIQEGHAPIVNGDGSQTRDFTFVENAVDANLLALDAESVGDGIFNVASGQQATVKQLAESVASFMGWKGGIEYGPTRSGDVLHSCADISKARTLLGYVPRTSFEEGLRQTLEWYTR